MVEAGGTFDAGGATLARVAAGWLGAEMPIRGDSRTAPLEKSGRVGPEETAWSRREDLRGTLKAGGEWCNVLGLEEEC